MFFKNGVYLKYSGLLGLFLNVIFYSTAGYAGDGTADAGIPAMHATRADVASNGAEYTLANADSALGINIAADVKVEIKGDYWNRVRSWDVALTAHAANSSDFPDTQVYTSFVHGSFIFTSSRHSADYTGRLPHKRPQTVDETVPLIVLAGLYEQRFVGLCNSMADKLRGEGMTNTQVFSQDRTIDLVFRSSLTADIGGGFAQSWGSANTNANFQLVCKKQQAPTHSAGVPQGFNGEETVHNVVASSLTIQEQVTLGGACKVILSGVIETQLPNAPVRFKYQHTAAGSDTYQWSEAFNVTTDHSKMVFFSHEYNVPNGPGKEKGQIRMVGVGSGPEFTSQGKSYSMKCREPGATDLVTHEPPNVSMRYDVLDEETFGSYVCPTRLRLLGTIEGRGAYSGNAIFFGDAYFSPQLPYEVNHNDLRYVIAERIINWDDLSTGGTASDTLLASPANGQERPHKDFIVGLTLQDSQGNIVASVPRQTHRLQCAKVLMGVGPNAVVAQTLLQSSPQPVKNPLKNSSKDSVKNSATAGQAAVFQSNELPDLVAKSLNVQGSLNGQLQASQAIRKENGRCLFDMVYAIENKGAVGNTKGFRYVLKNNGKKINQHKNIKLKAGQFESYYHQTWLRPGVNNILLKVDAGNRVQESKENNNRLTKRFTVQGRCGAEAGVTSFKAKEATMKLQKKTSDR